jgi:hypothetical protein
VSIVKQSISWVAIESPGFYPPSRCTGQSESHSKRGKRQAVYVACPSSFPASGKVPSGARPPSYPFIIIKYTSLIEFCQVMPSFTPIVNRILKRTGTGEATQSLEVGAVFDRASASPSAQESRQVYTN